LTAIVRAFSLGVEYRLIPCAPKIERLEENNIRTGFFEREQLDFFCRIFGRTINRQRNSPRSWAGENRKP
jgi:hypothetical protein